VPKAFTVPLLIPNGNKPVTISYRFKKRISRKLTGTFSFEENNS
jgi:hypothetical protein